MSRRRGRIRSGNRSVVFEWLDPVAASPIDVATGALLLTGIGLLAMVWGAAYLSSWLIGGEAAEINLSDAAVAMFRLGSNRFRWEGAWPAHIDAALPGASWFWTFFALEALAVALLFWPMWRLFGPDPADPAPVFIEPTPSKHPRRERREAAREARAARRQAAAGAAAGAGAGAALAPSVLATPGLGRILTDSPTGHQVVLGRSGRRYVATDNFGSVVAFGPTQSGKTSALTIPALLSWQGPALVVTAKPDLVSATWRTRAAMDGRTWLFDPMGSMAGSEAPTTPGASRSFVGDGWSPLALISSVRGSRNQPELDRRIRQWARARRTAQWMVGAARSNQIKGELPEPWFVAAEQMLAPMLLAAAADELTMGRVAEWVDRRDIPTVTTALERTGVGEALAAWEGARNMDAATMAGTYQILALIMVPYSEPRVARLAGDGGISAPQLLDGQPNTLYVLSPSHHLPRLRPLLTTLVSEVLDTAMGQATGSPAGRLRSPLLVVLDDAAECAPLHLLDQLASVGAGLGIQVVSIFGDLGHVERAFGPERAIQLADSHRALVVLPGVSDTVTLDYVNSLIQGTRLMGAEPPEDADDDAVVVGAPTWMRTLDHGDALCVYGNLPPVRIQLRPWYDDRALRRLVEPPAERQRRWGWRRRSDDDDGPGGGFPNPLDSDANDREAARYWEQAQRDGTLAAPRLFDDGSGAA